MRRPGQSAREEYRKLRGGWLRRIRGRFAIACSVCFVIGVGYNALGIWLGSAWIWAAGVVTGSILVALMAVRDMPPDYITYWQLGEWGEKATAKALRPLLQEGWQVLHDLQQEYGNIDHVVVGPGGVFLLDSKWLVGDVEVINDEIAVRRLEDPDLTYRRNIGPASRGAAAAMSQRLRDRARLGQWVYPVVVIHGRFAAGLQTVNGVTYVSSERLAGYLRDQPARLVPEHVERVTPLIRDAYEDRVAAHAA